jgi:hypothetical protein
VQRLPPGKSGEVPRAPPSTIGVDRPRQEPRTGFARTAAPGTVLSQRKKKR